MNKFESGKLQITIEDVIFQIKLIDCTKNKLRGVLTIELDGEGNSGQTIRRRHIDKIDFYSSGDRKRIIRETIENCYSVHDQFTLELFFEQAIIELEKFRISNLSKNLDIETEFVPSLTKIDTEPKKKKRKWCFFR